MHAWQATYRLYINGSSGRAQEIEWANDKFIDRVTKNLYLKLLEYAFISKMAQRTLACFYSPEEKAKREGNTAS